MKKATFDLVELRKILKPFGLFITQSTVLTILENIHIGVDKKQAVFSGTDLSIFYKSNINCESKEAFSCLINFKSLWKILSTKRLTGNVEISVEDDKRVKLQIGDLNFFWVQDDPDDFPAAPKTDVKDKKTVLEEIHTKELGVMLKTAMPFISKDGLRPAMCNVALIFNNGQIEIAATDAHALYFDKFTWPTIIVEEETPLLLDKKQIEVILTGLGPDILLSLSGNIVSVMDGTGREIIIRSCDEKFPKYKDVLPNKEELINVTVDKKAFLNILLLALPFTNRTTKQVRLKVKDEVMTITAEDIDFGSGIESKLPVSNEYKYEIEIGFNVTFLIKVISLIKSDELTIGFKHPNRACILNDKFLVMPVMLNQ